MPTRLAIACDYFLQRMNSKYPGNHEEKTSGKEANALVRSRESKLSSTEAADMHGRVSRDPEVPTASATTTGSFNVMHMRNPQYGDGSSS